MIGIRIKNLRKENKLTQEELSLKLNLSGKSAISNYENGYSEPNTETILELSKIFNVSTDYLLGNTDDPTPIRDVNQDLYDEHDYSKELEAFIKDNEISAAFQDYGSWTEEEKRNLLNFVKGQKALKELNKK